MNQRLTDLVAASSVSPTDILYAVLNPGTSPASRKVTIAQLLGAGIGKLMTFTRDTSLASGAQAITGVGFKPSMVIFIASITGTVQWSIGVDDGATPFMLASDYVDGAGFGYPSTAYSLGLFQSGAITLYGKLASRDSDGFTINWTKNGSKTGTANVFAICLR